MYKFLAYQWVMDWQAIDADHIADIAIKTQCHMCILDVKRDEQNFQSYVFGFAYQSIENLATLIRESGFRKGSWSAITQKEFLKGTQIHFSTEEDRDAAIRYFQFHKYELNPENNEFHQRLKTDWKDWTIFKADWRNKSVYDLSWDEREVLERTWQNMYSDAQMLGSLLGFVTLFRIPGLRRLFLPLPYYELLPRYIEQVAPHLDLSEWSLVEREEILNTIGTHGWQWGLVRVRS